MEVLHFADLSRRSRLHFESPQGLHVDVYSEARFAGKRDFAIYDLEFVRDEFLAQKGIAQIGRQEFDIRAVGRDGGEVGAGGDTDACLPAVWDNEPSSLPRHFGHAPRLRETADAPDVGLCDIKGPRP